MSKIGWNKKKYVEGASNLYKVETGEIFCFARCVPVLHKVPKFGSMVNAPLTSHDNDTSSQNEEVHEVHLIASRAIPTRTKKKENNHIPPQESNME